MKKPRRITFVVTALAGAVVLSSCSTIHRKAQLHHVETLSVDAKQRLVFSSTQAGTHGNKSITCAEPSPDALVAQAAALSANVSTPQQLSAALGASNTESAASIGLRTQTIQILRDGYFRICEAYMNGAISTREYKAVLYNVDAVIAVALAIDTLGGTVAAPAVGVNPGAATTSANGEGAKAETAAGAVVFENFVQDRGTLSDAQAKAIENITLHYLRHVQLRLAQADL